MSYPTSAYRYPQSYGYANSPFQAFRDSSSRPLTMASDVYAPSRARTASTSILAPKAPERRSLIGAFWRHAKLMIGGFIASKLFNKVTGLLPEFTFRQFAKLYIGGALGVAGVQYAAAKVSGSNASQQA